MNHQRQNQEKAQEIIVRLIQSDMDADQATDALIELGVDALEALSLGMDSDHLPAQRAATIALSRLETRRALAPILNGVLKLRAQPDLMAALLHSAAQLLTPRDAERVRPVLLRFLQHPSPPVRLAAAECARSTQDKKALDYIAQGPLTRQDHPTSSQSQHTVPRAASMSLIAELGAAAESVRRQARVQLLHHPDRDQIIVEHLHHANQHIRLSVLEVAAVVAKPEWNQALMDIAANETRATTERVLALRGVHHLSQLAQDIHLIRTLLQTHEEPLRAEAGRLAATSNTMELRHGALNLLSRDVPWVRKRIAEGWATFADLSRQSDLPHLIDILPHATWLSSPTPLDVETYQALSGGLVRMVELGCFIDASLLHDFAELRHHSTEEIAQITRQTAQTLAQSAGLTLTLDDDGINIQTLHSSDARERVAFLETLPTQPSAILHDILPQLIRFLYRASPEEVLLTIDVLAKIDDPRTVEALTRISRLPEPEAQKKAQAALAALSNA